MTNHTDFDNEDLQAEGATLDTTFAYEQWAESLLAQAKLDPVTPFMVENVMRAMNLRQTDFAAYESLRSSLKKAGIRVGQLDKQIDELNKNIRGDQSQKPNQFDSLMELVGDADFFCDHDGVAYADIVQGDRRETWPLTSTGFQRWLRATYYQKTKKSIAADALNTIINTLSARADSEGKRHQVFVRTAVYSGKIYIDLCTEDWQVVEVDVDGWRVINNPPVRFRRKRGTRPLPVPKMGGDIQHLRPFLNVRDDRGFVLVVAWLLMALSGQGPYPILSVVGEQGTAKSTLMLLLRQLVDPCLAPLRTLPREVRDLFVMTSGSLVLAFDNLSYLNDWISDALCRISTGGGFSVRQLHTDEDEVLFDAIRPIIMNGIENVGTRSDLVDRSIILVLEPIPDSNRKTLKQMQSEFSEVYPSILGALLDMIVHGLNKLPNVELEGSPRMADFAIWATACETAVWPAGTFIAAYEANRAESNEDVIAASALATAVCSLLERENNWSGTATSLLKELTPLVEGQVAFDRRLWPATQRVLSERLRRDAAALRRVGVEMVHTREYGNRIIKLSKVNIVEKPATSAPPATAVKMDDKISKFTMHRNKQTGAPVAQGAKKRKAGPQKIALPPESV